MLKHVKAIGCLMVLAAALAILAVPVHAAPPAGTYGPYPSYASPLYPAYNPSYTTPGNYASVYQGNFAAALARSLPARNPYPQTYLRFYIPSEIRGTERAPDNTAHLEVLLPLNAELWVNDWKARSTGTVRNLQSPPLGPGHKYTYTVRAQWKEDGREVTQSREVAVAAGSDVRVNFFEPPAAPKNRAAPAPR